MTTLAPGLDYVDLRFLDRPSIIATAVLQSAGDVALGRAVGFRQGVIRVGSCRVIARTDDQLSVCRWPPEHVEDQRRVDHQRRHAAQVGDVGAVWILFCSGHETGSHRVQVDVPDKSDQMWVSMAHEGLVAPLKQVADRCVGPIEVLRVGLLHGLHELR